MTTGVEAAEEMARLLQLAYHEARGKDPEICTMELAGGGECWCRKVRAALKNWEDLKGIDC